MSGYEQYVTDRECVFYHGCKDQLLENLRRKLANAPVRKNPDCRTCLKGIRKTTIVEGNY